MLNSARSHLDQHLINALFDVVPEDWRAFRLTVMPAREGGGAPRLALLNPDVADADGTPGAEVERLVGELVALLAHENRPWPHISYSGHLGADGEWRMRIVAPLPAEEAPPAP